MEKEKDGKIYTILSNIAIVGLFLSVGILIAAVLNGNFNASAILGLCILAIVFGGCALSLVWVKNLERKRFVKTSIVFLAFTALCCVLWIVCAIIIYNIMKKPSSVNLGVLNFIRITFIISLQFVFANVIARNIIRYKKRYIPFQIIHYTSCVYVDFFLSLFATAIQFKASGSIWINFKVLGELFNGVFMTIFVIAAVYILISNSIIDSIEKKNGTKTGKRNIFDKVMQDPELEEDLKKVEKKEEVKPITTSTTEQSASSSTKKRLDELKKLLDEDVITQEEYDAKRKDILKDI